MKKKRKIQITVTIVTIGILIYIFILWHKPDNYVLLNRHGKASLYIGNFVSHEKFNLEFSQGQWRWSGKDASGIFVVGFLEVPFECPFNDYRGLRIEDNGTLWVVDKSKSDRYELRVVDGEWSYDVDGDWAHLAPLDLQ